MAIDPKIAQAIEEKMRPLRERYVVTLEERMKTIERTLGKMVATSPIPQEEWEELQSCAHKLAGTGTTYGFPEISAEARKLEDAMREGMGSEQPRALELVIDLMETCHQALAKAKAPPPEATTETRASDTIGITEVDPPEPPAVHLPTVLILDDDPDVLSLLTDMLNQHARVLTGDNARDGLAMIREHQPDLVLLDNQMPGGISGLSLLENLHATPEFEGIPVIMISASNKSDEVMRGLMAGAVDYIIKPFDAQELANKVRKRLIRLQSHILVADDDPAIRDLIQVKLRAAGCQVVTATDGADAWKKLHEKRFALVVSDLMMPGLDGMTLLKKMREEQGLAGVPVVLLTARHMSTDILDGLNSGAADYITKPFNSDEVVTRCTRLLSSQPVYS